MKFANLICE